MFNVRVYGILIDNRGILVSDELIRGQYITKFCGGGLEHGEGTRECLKREFREEMQLEIDVQEHIYTTDFYQDSAFKPGQQIISVYYRVTPIEKIKVPLRKIPFEFDEWQMKQYELCSAIESFRFIPINQFTENDVTLPIDKKVASEIKKKYYSTFFFTPLENETVKLEPLDEKHYDYLLQIAMNKEIWQYTAAKISNENDFKIYFSNTIIEMRNGESFPFAVYHKKTQQYTGCTRYTSFSPEHKKLEIGYTWYSPDWQGSGINAHCKYLLLEYGFEYLTLNRIELKTSSLNYKSQRAIEKLGAVREGLHRKHIINNDGYVRDTVFYSFIKDDWNLVKENIINTITNIASK